MEQVADDPPCDKEDYIALESDGMESDALEPVEPVPEVIPRDKHCNQRIGYRENEKIVIAQSLGNMAVGERIERPL